MSSPKKLLCSRALYLIPLILGFGVYPLLILGLIFSLSVLLNLEAKLFLTKICDPLTKPGFLFFLALVALFLILYWGFYIPYRLEITKMPWAYFEVLFALFTISLLWVGIFTKTSERIEFIWYFCLGAFLLVLGTVGATLVLKSPPYYANVIDIRYLPFGMERFINTPGMANLLSLFPVTFLAGILLKPDQRPKWFWLMGIFGFVLSLGAAITLGQRSYFLVVLVIVPIILVCLLLLLKSWHPFIAFCSLLLSYPIINWIAQIKGMPLFFRSLNQNLVNDPRFQMLRFWFDHLIANPFQRASVGPAPWDTHPWFHNFFADIHRLSGFWALLAAVILVSYIFYTILRVVRRDKRMGLFLMVIAITCFLIMNTSVVPEGERQPFLLLLVIGAIAQLTISREKNKLKMNSSTPSQNTGQEPS